MCTTCGCGESDELASARMITIEQSLFSKNNQFASQNRRLLHEQDIVALNLMSSPGAGKTTLLIETLKYLHRDFRAAVIEGDQQTEQDAERIRSTGFPAIQINTGKGCHLDAHQVGHALAKLDLASLDFVFIENVGNLVCPAGFDLGEQSKVVIFSVTEGEDKPIKYPDIFQAADLMLVHKTDLLPYLDFDLNLAVEYARKVNPEIEVISLSSKSGDGMDKWIQWLSQFYSTIFQ